MSMRAFLFVSLLATAASMPAMAQSQAGALDESVFTVPTSVKDVYGRAVSGPTTVTQFKPAGAGPFPLAVLLHGRGDRAATARFRYQEAAAWLVARGFAVLVPTRLGYGQSDNGSDPEDAGVCGHKNFAPAFEAAAAGTVAVIDRARRLPFIDARRIVVLGQSYGGVTAIALAARNTEGVVGVVNFSGGAGGDPDKRPGAPCDAMQLASVFAGYGAATQVPTLWLYTANDRSMGNSAPSRWYAAFKDAGGGGEFVSLPAVGDDGHMLFTKGFAAWRPQADRFLNSLGFAQASMPAAGTGTLP